MEIYKIKIYVFDKKYLTTINTHTKKIIKKESHFTITVSFPIKERKLTYI